MRLRKNVRLPKEMLTEPNYTEWWLTNVLDSGEPRLKSHRRAFETGLEAIATAYQILTDGGSDESN